jgi:hypothetical protein
MSFPRIGRKRSYETIDQTAARAEEARKSQAIELSKRLGERAMEGEYFGVAGFMAIGFPELVPSSKEYRDMVNACRSVQEIPPGRCIRVGEEYYSEAVFGIKSNANRGRLAFDIKPHLEGYWVEANVLCSRALYGHNPSTADPYGSEQEPYKVYLIDSMIGPKAKPVTEISLPDSKAYSLHHDRAREFAERLMAESVAVPA